ncbi:MAG: hypothetical protein Q7R97_05680 [Candidatus Daviesbacteria bacterium]|nr:hypothetical protein [Candidatus Daviesbacteria bacterium]
MAKKFTLESALKARKEANLEEWVQQYLRDEGHNIKLADILRENKIVWVDLIKYNLDKLKRAMGPEEEMPFKEEKEKWEERIENFSVLIKGGFTPPPIIATDFWDDISISDGTHRFEALKQTGHKKYWVIFFIKNSISKQKILENL